MFFLFFTLWTSTHSCWSGTDIASFVKTSIPSHLLRPWQNELVPLLHCHRTLKRIPTALSCGYLTTGQFAPNRLCVLWAPYLTTVSQVLASCLKCGRFSINVETMKNLNENNTHQAQQIAPMAPTPKLVSLLKPIRKIHLILQYHCHLLLCTLHRALIKFSIGSSLGK